MFETQGGTRKRTRDLPRKGSAYILSSDHWTMFKCGSARLCFELGFLGREGLVMTLLGVCNYGRRLL